MQLVDIDIVECSSVITGFIEKKENNWPHEFFSRAMDIVLG